MFSKLYGTIKSSSNSVIRDNQVNIDCAQ